MEPELGEGSPIIRYRNVLGYASAVSFVSIIFIFCAWFPKDESHLLGEVGLLPVSLPYAFIPLRLYGQKLRSGITLAITMGCAMLVPGIYLVRFATSWDKRWWVLGSVIVGLLTQLVLIVVGAKAYMRLSHTPRVGLKGLAGPALTACRYSQYSYRCTCRCLATSARTNTLR